MNLIKPLLNNLPGLLAWILEGVAVVTALLYVVCAAREAFTGDSIAALLMLAVAAASLAIVLLADYYNRSTPGK